MNTKQLHCFLRVADKLNFTKAAEELYLSTPTVTHHIQSLEAELNTKLFVRNKKMVRLTEAGMVFCKDAEEIMMKCDLAKKHAEKIAAKNVSTVRIGCSSNAELGFLRGRMAEFRREHPGIQPSIVVTNYMQLIRMLGDKQLDMVFGTRDMMKGFSGYTFKVIKKMVTCAVVSEENPLWKQEMLCFEDFANDSLIVLHPKMIPFKYGNEVGEQIQRHAEKHLDIFCENDQVGIAMALAGYGVAILPEFCIPQELMHSNVKNLKLCENEEMEYGVLYQTKDKDGSMKKFMAVIDVR